MELYGINRTIFIIYSIYIIKIKISETGIEPVTWGDPKIALLQSPALPTELFRDILEYINIFRYLIIYSIFISSII